MLLFDLENGFVSPPREEWPDLAPYQASKTEPFLIYGIATDAALHFLLAAEIIFIGNSNGVAGLFVNCNDVFVPAADAEPLPVPLGYSPKGKDFSEPDEALLDLYRRVKAHGVWGAMTWVAFRRKEGPWRESVRSRWIESGAWDPMIDTFGGWVPPKGE